ncbi:c-type cytochrome [Solemya velum gill symbiont]|uniref:Cytochrome c556 n=1 Tax=Solemya velum gill symbiont TaxID=2340 RepID=A0A0B0HAT7_SOVGS|nr:cytochrome c [Solemya velum gill symbiont]KHF24964.1 cytochrome c556 [Solemya velum gill symbiont]OOY34624.1 hypothetical protein BOV88_09225 [Solemya velum gill symbiont]OOY37416.1 hypothetical protein BOV89_07655 [Solemya velum gill symbiont]OOY40404.1 hypothetical protein BOV90_04350 [Solemya velum gill symbiont]OOY42898.1 hypothetical protein BOV91_05565 [Solemya velum gill symbiont]
MKTPNRKFLSVVAGLALGIGAIGTASAWYYAPSYYGPHGPNSHKQDRQGMMRDHGWAMRDLAAIIQGRKPFDRREATMLAREIEAGAGENLWRLYSPSSVASPGSRAAPSVWGSFDNFKANAAAMKESADRLADALEKRPTSEDYKQGVWVPEYSSPYGNRWGERDGGIIKEALNEYMRLNTICNACHQGYRGSRWQRW